MGILHLSESFANEDVCVPMSSFQMEKVYLHLDNTSYLKGDKIWFKAYVVNADGNTFPSVSNTLYVELLNPGGELIKRKIYKVEEGHAHGDFTINHLPFYSGYYEIRAYTKYMLNFGEQNYFSRIIPIFDSPKQDSDSANVKLRKRVKSKFQDFRKSPKKGKKVNLRFYPEGGHTVKGIQSCVAFEATDADGFPLDVKGTVFTEDNLPVANIEVRHEGKGRFKYTPTDLSAYAKITYGGDEYKFKLPKPLERGYVLSVDNLTDEQNVKVRVSRSNGESKDTVGVILLSQGRVIDYAYIASKFEKPLNISFDKRLCLSGVSEIVLVDQGNEKIANRYIFNKGDATFAISAKLDKSVYKPFEPMTVSFSLKGEMGTPITAPFSLSIRDGSDEIKWNRNIMTDLLLMSDIKGYVSNPTYYFESDNAKHQADLDLLLMVQGWQKFSYDKIKGINEDNLRYMPETKGITVDGIVSHYNVKKTREGIDVSVLMLNKAQEKGENDGRAFYENKFVTDSLGRFHFVADVTGNWDMILSASKNLKKQNLTITLDNQFSPVPRRYEPYELFLKKRLQKDSDSLMEFTEESDSYNLNTISNDSDYPLMMNNGHNEKSIMLQGIEVKGKKSSKANDIYRARANSIAYYDFKENADRLYDEGFYYCDDIDEFLRKVNPNFFPYIEGDFKCLLYRDKFPLVVIDYERTELPYEFRYNELPVEWIKSVYISENENLIANYCDPRMPKLRALKHYGCVVFIETYPEEERPASATWGVRKTTFHGYDNASEFYNPDYSGYRLYEEDYRRTLYWNPMVMPDDNGNVQIRIYNNKSCQYPIIDAQTVTSSGMIGLSKHSLSR